MADDKNGTGTDTVLKEDEANLQHVEDATLSSSDTDTGRDGHDSSADDAEDDVQDSEDDATKWKSLARKWQARSESNLAELKKAKEQSEKLQGEIEALKADAERDAELSKISEESGVPKDILAGYADIDAARDAASKIKAWAGHKTYPSDQGGAPQGEAASTVTKTSIESLSSPIARVKARAAHADLYRSK